MEPLEIEENDASGRKEQLEGDDHDHDEEDEFRSLVRTTTSTRKPIMARKGRGYHHRVQSSRTSSSSSSSNSNLNNSILWLVAALILSILLYQVKRRLYPENDTSSSNALGYNPSVLKLRTHPPPLATLLKGGSASSAAKKKSKHHSSIPVREKIIGKVDWMLDWSASFCWEPHRLTCFGWRLRWGGNAKVDQLPSQTRCYSAAQSGAPFCNRFQSCAKSALDCNAT